MKGFLIILFGLILVGCGGQEVRPQGQDESAAQAYTQLGMQYLRSGDTANAKSAFQRAQELAPDILAAYNGLALVFQLEDEPELAETYFKKALKKAPDSAMLHNNYGAFLFNSERYPEACRELARATEDPFYNLRDQAFENLGRCYQLINRPDAAEHALKRSLKLNPQRPFATLELAKVLFEQGKLDRAEEYFEQYGELVDSKQVEHNATSLWLGVQISRMKNDALNAATYGLILKSMYPDSEEYKKYKESTP